MSNFFPTGGFKWIDPKEFDPNKYTSNSSKECVFKVELQELHNDCHLAPDKVEIKREILSEYQLKITELCNIPIGNVKKLEPNNFGKEKYMFHYGNF